MNAEAYEILALTARYFFTGLMLLIVLRAVRGALADSRKSVKLRRLSPKTGVTAELKVLKGGGNSPMAMEYDVPREGILGSSRRADICIRSRSVRRRHAYFETTEESMKIRCHAGARIYDAEGRSVREGEFHDGDRLRVGGVTLLLVMNLTAGKMPPVDDDDSLFEWAFNGGNDDFTDSLSEADRRKREFRRKMGIRDDFNDDLSNEDIPKRGAWRKVRPEDDPVPPDSDHLFDDEFDEESAEDYEKAAEEMLRKIRGDGEGRRPADDGEPREEQFQKRRPADEEVPHSAAPWDELLRGMRPADEEVRRAASGEEQFQKRRDADDEAPRRTASREEQFRKTRGDGEGSRAADEEVRRTGPRVEEFRKRRDVDEEARRAALWKAEFRRMCGDDAAPQEDAREAQLRTMRGGAAPQDDLREELLRTMRGTGAAPQDDAREAQLRTKRGTGAEEEGRAERSGVSDEEERRRAEAEYLAQMMRQGRADENRREAPSADDDDWA